MIDGEYIDLRASFQKPEFQDLPTTNTKILIIKTIQNKAFVALRNPHSI
jgi:hypothetical protein